VALRGDTDYSTIEAELLVISNPFNEEVLYGIALDAAANGWMHKERTPPESWMFASANPWKTYDGSCGFHRVLFMPEVGEELGIGNLQIQSECGVIANGFMHFNDYNNAVMRSHFFREQYRISPKMFAGGYVWSAGNSVFLRYRGQQTSDSVAPIIVDFEGLFKAEFEVGVVSG